MYNDRYRTTQSHFDGCHYWLKSGEWTREKYVEQINYLWCGIHPEDRKSLQRRKDRRTLGEFALQVYDSSMREKFLITEWLKILGREDVRIEDYGIANDGRIIMDPDGEQGKPDYRIISDKGVFKFEVKFCPTAAKLTFKSGDLHSYIDHDATVLIIMANMAMIGPNGFAHVEKPLEVPAGTKWTLLFKETCKKMLLELPVVQYREIGYKRGVQLKKHNMHKFIKVRDWLGGE